MFVSSYTVFVPTLTILSAIDFWFTKNIAGRLLVGLLWRRVIVNDEDTFIYHCLGDESQNNKLYSWSFWWLQYISAGFWLVMLFFRMLTPQVFVVLLPAVLNVFNLYAYYNCSKEKQGQVNAYVQGKTKEATGAALQHVLDNQGLNSAPKY